MFALIYSCGVSTSYHELVGLYSTREKAEEGKEKDIKKHTRWEYKYRIEEIKTDTEVNIMYDEW